MGITFLQIIHTRFQNVAQLLGQEGNTFIGEYLYLEVDQNMFYNYFM